LVAQFRGRPLAGLSEARVRPLLGALQQLDCVDDRQPLFGFIPHRIWEFRRVGDQQDYLVFEADQSSPHPGSTRIRLTLFDDFGAIRAKSQFATGHRCYLYGEKLERVAGIEGPVLALQTGLNAGPGPDFARQYYALIGRRFDLIRVEGSGGGAVPNDYYVKHFACGPAPPRQSDSRWEADLRGRERARVLRTLVWLGGTHRLLEKGERADRQFEDEEDVQAVRRVRARPGLAARLRELADRGLPWEREAARLALAPEDARW
jgi:hypothetical protein